MNKKQIVILICFVIAVILVLFCGCVTSNNKQIITEELTIIDKQPDTFSRVQSIETNIGTLFVHEYFNYKKFVIGENI